MRLRNTLARSYATAHPAEAAAMLENRPVSETIHVLDLLPQSAAAELLRRLSSASASRALESMQPSDAARVLGDLPLEVAAALLRRLGDSARASILAALSPDLERDLRSVIEWPFDTAGALMSPRAISLPGDLTAEVALTVVQRDAEHALYNLYVVDRDGLLTGVLNLQELLHASREDRLDAIAHPAHHRLPAGADLRAVLHHPGWQEVYSLPVVDAQGRFLGAVRYRALRRLERELHGPAPAPGALTASALGDLFRTGVVGVIDALSGASIAPHHGAPTHMAAISTEKETGDDRYSGE